MLDNTSNINNDSNLTPETLTY